MRNYLYKVACEHFAFGLALSVNVVWQLSRGLTLGQAALIEAVALAVRFLLDVPTGRLSDRLGRKPVLVAASAFFGFGYLTLSVAHTFITFLIAALLSAVGFALLSGSEEALVFETASTNYRYSYSRLTVVDEAATITGLLVSALIVKFYGIQASLVAAAAIMGLTVAIGLIFIQEPPRRRAVAAGKSTLSQAVANTRQLLRVHLPLIAIFLCLAVYNEAGRVLWQPRLTEAGLAVQYLGLTFALFKVASLIGAYLARHQRMRDIRRELVWVGGLLAAALALMAAPILALVIIGFMAYFALENVYRIAQSHYLQQIAPDNNRATLLSVAGFTRTGYSFLTLPVLGYLSQGGRTRSGFLLLVGLQVVAAAVLFAMAKRQPSATPAS